MKLGENYPQAFIGGRIITSYSPLRIVGGFVVNGGEVIYAGDPSTASNITKMLGGEIIDLKGRWVIPGFVDSHIHLDGLGMLEYGLNLNSVPSIDEMKRKLKSFSETRQDKVIFGRGWDQELFKEARWPNIRDLDEVIKDRPVVLVRKCGHAAVLNSVAMDSLMETGLPESMKKFIDKGDDGKPTGLVFEDLVQYSLRVLFDESDYKEILLGASRRLASLGVTSVGFMSASPQMYRALVRLEREGLLRTRIHVYFDQEYMNYIIKAGVTLSSNNSLVLIRGVKTYADGSLGARTAYLSEDYADAPGNRGVPLKNSRELKEFIEKCTSNLLQPSIHAIGDAALKNVIKAYKESKNKHPRLRVEHASLATPDLIKELAENKILISIQPRFVVSDWWASKRLGPDRLKNLYPFKTMAKTGITLGISTDSPVEPPDPRETINAAENRGQQAGIKGGCKECLKRYEVLQYYTRGSAEILLNRKIGCLERGCKADFIILGDNVLDIRNPYNLIWEKVYLEGVRIH